VLHKENVISHPIEGFAEIKSRGSRNRIKKKSKSASKCSRNKTKRFQVSICFSQLSLPMLMAEDNLFSLCWWHVKFGNRVNFQFFPMDKIRNELKTQI
jgi:hypothetical protein